MARYVVLGGYGDMGSVCVRDLFETTKDEIVVVGRDATKAKKFAHSFKSPRVKWASADLNNVNATAKVLKGADVAVNCAQYYVNLSVMHACLKANVNYLDLGGLYYTTKKQLKLDKAFIKIKKVALLGCGSSPGTTNIMAAYGGKLFDRVEGVYFRFAGKDWTRYDQPFVIPYSADTLIDEFTMKPGIVENGRDKIAEPLSRESIETFPKPVGKMKCFRIVHSEVAMIKRLFPELKNCDFQECFPEEFATMIKFLVDTGFADETTMDANGVKIRPRDITVSILSKWLPKPSTRIKDLEYLVVELRGKKNGRSKKIEVICEARTHKNIPAGTWDTGTPPSIIAQMVVRGNVKVKGVHSPGRWVPHRKYFNELKKRGMRVYVS